MHIAVVCDLMLPLNNSFASSRSIRLWGISEGLLRSGAKVSYIVSDKVGNLVFPEHDSTVYYYNDSNINRILDEVNADVVLVQNWQIAEKINRKKFPLIIDLENSGFVNDIYSHDINTQIRKIKALRKGDLFICSTQKQKWFYLNWLLQSGFDVSENLIKVIPLYYPRKEEILSSKGKKISFVSYWDSSSLSNFDFLNLVLSEVDGKEDVSFKLVSGANSYQRGMENYLVLHEHLNMKSENLKISEVFSWSDLVDEYKKSSVGICLDMDSIQSQMGMNSDGVHYLSCGIPILCNSGTELAGLVEEYGAGWIVDSSDPKKIRARIRRIMRSPRKIESAVKKALTLSREKFGNIDSFRPLIEFCKSPRKVEPSSEGMVSHLIDYSHKVLNMNNPLLNDIYIENILILLSGSWEQLGDCLEAVDIMFPISEITVVCPTYRLMEDMEITPECNLILYEDDLFEPVLLKETLSVNSNERFDLAIALFNNTYGDGYTDLNKSLLCSGAKYKIGFTADHNFIMVEDSIEKCISEVLENCVEVKEIKNSKS